MNPELLLGTVAGEVSRINAESLANAVDATINRSATTPAASPSAPPAKEAGARRKPGRRASVLNGAAAPEKPVEEAPAKDVPPPAPALRADESAVRTAGGTFVIRRTRGR